MKLRYFAHSAFQITTDDNTKILVDPFLDDNQNSPVKSKEVEADYIILSHGHGDHVGDSVKIAKRTNPIFIGVLELANYFSSKGFQAHGMQIGGGHNFDFGRLKLTIAHHGSSTPEGQYAGLAAGMIFTISGKVIYYTGDTALFSDMKLIGDTNTIDYMLLPIGDNFTMGINDAVMAVDMVKPKTVIPVHYNTWPVINADPNEFKEKVEALGIKCKVLNFGEEIEL